MGICNDVHFAVIKEFVDHGADQHLIGCGGADPGGADHVARNVGIESADLISHLLETCQHSFCQIDSPRHLVARL